MPHMCHTLPMTYTLSAHHVGGGVTVWTYHLTGVGTSISYPSRAAAEAAARRAVARHSH